MVRRLGRAEDRRPENRLMSEPRPVDVIPFREALKVWARIGLLSFGGPAAQIALMHRILVEEKRWIGESRFLHALNYCMLLPGPEAQQLTVYVGWLLHRLRGGLVAGTLFVLPGVVVMLALSLLYVGYRDLTLVQGLFFGIKAAVLAVVVEAVLRLGRRALRNGLMLALAAAAFVAIFFFDVAFPLIVVGAGLTGLVAGRLFPQLFAANGGTGDGESGAAGAIDAALASGRLDHTRPSTARALRVLTIGLLLWLGPVVMLFAVLGPSHVYTQEGFFFSKMAVVTFGGAYAVLAYVAQQAVENHGWLRPGEMLDGLGLAETTPGPLIMVVQFVGFLGAYRNPGLLDPMLAGTLGALLTTWVTFVPCYIWIFLGGPYVESLRGNRALTTALSAITAAIVGVVLNLAVWFALHVSFGELRPWRGFGMRLDLPVWATVDAASVALAAAAMLAMLRFKTGMVPTLAACAGLGLVYILATA